MGFIVFLVACACVGIGTKSFSVFFGVFLLGFVFAADADARTNRIINAKK
jgi:hypothetical protein